MHTYTTTKEQDMEAVRAITEMMRSSLIAQVKEKGRSVVEYHTETGAIFGFSLMSKPKISVQDTFSTKGSELAFHRHLVKEWLIVYEGLAEITLRLPDGDVVKTLEAGDSIYIDTGTTHNSKFLQDTRMLAVSVPADGGYPSDNGDTV